MGWPRKLYVATKTLGVYYTEDFSVPTTQPTWAAVNGGLPATDVRQFALDPFDPVGKQYLLLETARTLYRRDSGGNWAAILTSAQADTLTECDPWSGGGLIYFTLDETVAGRLWVCYLGNGGLYSEPYYYQEIHALYSDDYGDNWTDVTTIRREWGDAAALHSISAVGDAVFVASNTGSGAYMRLSANKGTSWSLVSITAVANKTRINKLQPTLCYYGGLYTITAAGTITALDGVGISQDSIWFSTSSADHHRIVNSGKLYVTANSWTSKNTPDAITPAPLSIAPWAGADEDQILVSLTLDTDPAGGLQGHVIGALYGEDDTTAVGIAGTNCETDPYTDAIPMTCGGAAIGGIAAVEEAATEQPVPPDDGTITVPGNGPVTLKRREASRYRATGVRGRLTQLHTPSCMPAIFWRKPRRGTCRCRESRIKWWYRTAQSGLAQPCRRKTRVTLPIRQLR
jgi:hypothetical protein